ncbi:MAG: DUF2304 domain-containing protein [bacterium]|nr:DUF2304 domain-containing protein [bacterium]
MRLALLIVAILGIVHAVTRFRKRDIRPLELGLWAAIWVLVAVVAVVPEGTNRLADILGIGRGADVIVYGAVVVLAGLLFRMSVRLEQLDRAITKVTRELALREGGRHDGE